MSIYEEIKKALQDLIAPDIREIKGELKAINVRLDGTNERIEHLVNMLKLERRLDALERQQKEAEQ
jgi:hypothetical protein